MFYDKATFLLALVILIQRRTGSISITGHIAFLGAPTSVECYKPDWGYRFWVGAGRNLKKFERPKWRAKILNEFYEKQRKITIFIFFTFSLMPVRPCLDLSGI